MVKIIIDSAIPFIRGVFEPVAKVEYHDGSNITSDIVKDADALIIRTRTHCNKNLLENSRVSLICTATIGFDHIDSAYCAEKNITWYSMAGCNSNSVAHYFLATLALLYQTNILNFNNLTVGIVGMGNVGSKIARYCKALNINVLANDPLLEKTGSKDDFYSFEEVVATSDIITFHVPLTKSGDYSTFQMVNRDSLSKIKPSATLINTSRGEIVKEDDLLHLIENKCINNVVLDVWNNEPSINLTLLERAFISTSHIAGYSADGKWNGTYGCVQKVSQFFGFQGLEERVHSPLPPNNPNISVDCRDKSFESIFSEIVLKTYPIQNDSNSLKENANCFENLRNNYPNRREFGSYNLKLINDLNNYCDVFKQLGFNLDSYETAKL